MLSHRISRRAFVGSAVAAGAAVTLGPTSRVRGANEDIRVAVIGMRNRGNQVGGLLRKVPGVNVTTLCDVDPTVLDERVAEFNKDDKYRPVKGVGDLRDVINDKNIDAIAICTPNHWHALAAIWAMEAGKDLYLEKPITWSIWEGQQVLAAAKKYNRIVQSGTQSRSDKGFNAAIADLRGGIIGEVQYAHALYFFLRNTIGKVDGPQQPPKGVDYDLWCGPASNEPLMRKNLHYDWHWQWEHGNGDMSNIDIHSLDECRHALGLNGMARSITNLFGGRFVWDDDGETPNMQLAYVEYDIPVLLQIRSIRATKDRRARPFFRKVNRGVVLQCEGGYLAGGRTGSWIYDSEGKRIKQYPGDGGASHQQNFIDAVRTRNADLLISPLEQGNLSSIMCHAANISHLIGQQQSIDEIIANRSKVHEQVPNVLEHMKEQLAANEVDYTQTPAYSGPRLVLDEKTHRFVGENAAEANKYLRREKDREPFVVPTLV